MNTIPSRASRTQEYDLEDDVAIFQVSLFVQDGLLTPDEATDFVRGKGI